MLAVIGRYTQRLWAQKRVADEFAAAGTCVGVRHAYDRQLGDSRDWSLPLWLVVPPRIVDIQPNCGADKRLLRPAVLQCSHLPDLEILRLEVVDFEFDDECAAQFASLNELRSLHAPGSLKLTAAGFKKLLRPKLEELILGRCDLKGLEIEPGEWPASLTMLSLERCAHLTGRSLAHLLQPGLECIHFDATDLSDADLEMVQLPPNLKSISLWNAKSLTSRGLAKLLGPRVRSFHVYGAELSDLDVQKLDLSPALRELTLSPCSLLTNASVERIVARCPNLNDLRLRSLLLDDRALDHLARLESRSLKRIELSSPLLTTAALAGLSLRYHRESEVIITLDGRVGHAFDAGRKRPWRTWPGPW